MTEVKTRPFEAYGVSGRTFWIKCTDLIVSRLWERQPYYDRDAGARFSILIQGKAISATDSVCVIGKEDRATNEFNLTILSDAYAKQSWEEIRAAEEIVTPNYGTTPELQMRAHIFERLNENPPTATLYVTDDDWEMGIKGGWSIECKIPPSILAQFEAELPTQRVPELYMRIKWEAGLVHGECYGMAIHDPTALWGLFTVGERQTAENLRGHIESIRWDIPNESGVPDQPVTQEQLQAQERNIEDQIDRLGGTLAGHMRASTRNCVVGFWAVIALILVGHFLR